MQLARYTLAAMLTGIGVLLIGAFFWHENYRYTVPTPVPLNYKAVRTGEKVAWQGVDPPTASTFFHFYSPECPCSRFNVSHLRSLIREYGADVAIVVVVQEERWLEGAREAFGDGLDYRIDSNGALAQACGVYSTPQAAILDETGRLYYRGNYNQSRFCTARATNYAELALIALLNKQPPPVFDLFATQAYGCELDSQNEIVTLSF